MSKPERCDSNESRSTAPTHHLKEGAGSGVISRRTFVKRTVVTAAPLLAIASLEGVQSAEPPGTALAAGALNVLCVGGHPDDPESGCAGTLARYTELGHRVTVLYLTRGERGISGTALDD